MEIKVSAVVPVFNSVNTLARAINSLLIQPEIDEIFIVDDGSSDGSFELAKNLESKQSFIKVLNHEGRINKGASASRNLGLKYCKNEWIQFLDADDELLEGKIAEQLKYVNPKYSLIVGLSRVVSKQNIVLRKPIRDVFSGIFCGKVGDTCANLWNKNTVIEAGGWDEDLPNTQEYDLMFRIFKLNSNVYLSQGVKTNIYYQENSITFSTIDKKGKLDNHILLKNSIRDYLISIHQFNYRRKYFYSVGICNIKRFHKSEIKTFENILYYLIYKTIKSIKDRI